MSSTKVDLVDSNGNVYGWELISDGSGLPAVPTHITEFSAEDLLLAFTRAEFDAIDGNNTPDVKKFVRSLTMRQRAQISVTDPEYIPDIELLLSESLISQPRHDELIQGLPI